MTSAGRPVRRRSMAGLVVFLVEAGTVLASALFALAVAGTVSVLM
jgi:hypothetical protein